MIITPHCNGTHTECLGHITHERYSIHEQLKDSLIPATLISVVPERAMSSGDTYKPEKNKEDVFISKDVLKKSFDVSSASFFESIDYKNPAE